MLANEVKVYEVVGDVAGRTCILVDDMIDTAGTITKAAEALMENGAARGSGRGDARGLVGPGGRPAEELPDFRGGRDRHACRCQTSWRFDKLTVLTIAPLLARAISEVFEDGSVTSLFDGAS